MKKMYIGADFHFWHFNIIGYTGRPYANEHHMNQDLINKWNAVVQPEDYMVVVGDFAFSKKATINRCKEIRQQLNGTIILSRGNHERIHSRKQWIEYVGINYMLEKHLEYIKIDNYIIVNLYEKELNKPLNAHKWHDKKVIYVSHRPIKAQTFGPYYYGHVHEKVLEDQFGACVSVEQINYTPILLGEIEDENR